jgi:hypothetical protein
MTDFIKGKDTEPINKASEPLVLFGNTKTIRNTPLEFSESAMAVFNAGLQLYKYYHQQPNCNVNAALYDIREHFQGRNEAGKMNNKSGDATYTQLIAALRDSLKILAREVETKVYEYGFLKQ